MNESIKVLVADDHEMLRAGVSGFLDRFEDIEVVAEASNGLEMIEMAKKFLPDVILADILMPVMDGVEATKIITKDYPGIAVIAYSMYSTGQKIDKMIRAGARGYLLKGAHKMEIVAGIRAVHAKHDYYCNGTSEILKEEFNAPPSGSVGEIEFTDMERQLFPYLCKGLSSKEISGIMHRAPKTIEKYRMMLLEKTGCKNTTNLVFFLTSHNIYRDDPLE